MEIQLVTFGRKFGLLLRRNTIRWCKAGGHNLGLGIQLKLNDERLNKTRTIVGLISLWRVGVYCIGVWLSGVDTRLCSNKKWASHSALLRHYMFTSHLTVQSDGRGLSTTDDDEAIEQLQTLTHTWPMSLHGDAWHRLTYKARKFAPN